MTGGILLAISLPGFLISAGVLILFVLVTRHAARGSLFAALIIPAVLWLAGYRGAIIYAMVLAGLVIAGRFFVDWNRKYRELWLDRQK